MRHPRIVEPGFPHHIILRGNNRRRLFSYPDDYRAFFRYLAAAVHRVPVELHNACAMSNHVHLIATPPTRDALSAWVQSFGQRYAQRRNRVRGGTGKLFEQRFRSFPILDARYLEACTAYVELNPVRAGIVAQAGRYRWSTCRLLAGDRVGSALSPLAWTPSPFHRSLGASFAEQAAGFTRWMGELEALPMEPELPSEHFAAADAAEELSQGYGLRLLRPNGQRCE